MSETGARKDGPASSSPGHGIWHRRNGRHYDDSFLLLLFNPNGTFAGTLRVNQNIELDASGDSWNSNDTSQVIDANGNDVTSVISSCATSVGTRFE